MTSWQAALRLRFAGRREDDPECGRARPNCSFFSVACRMSNWHGQEGPELTMGSAVGG